MRKLLIPLIITLLSLTGNNCFAQTFGGGNGTIGTPYLISTSTHLSTIATNVNNGTNNYSGVYFIMTSNINLPANFTPIGYNSPRNFRGNFNGDNYKIRMSKITSIYNLRAGLFGYTYNASIENVSMVLDSIYITGNQNNNVTGILIAYADNTIINNCNVGDSTDIYYSNLKTNNIVGGMIGYAYNCSINLSYSLSSLRINSQGDNNNNSIGGLIGKAVNCTINNCYTRNDILTDSQNNNSGIGGLVGTTQNSSFSNSYSAPGSFDSGFPFTGIIVSDTTGSNTTFDNCYYLIDSSTTTNVGTGLTIDQMLDDSFIDSLNNGQSPPVWDSEGGLPSVSTPIVWSGEGSGTAADPFRVRYVKDLIYISEMTRTRSFRNYFLRMENDIDFHRSGQTDSSQFFNPIGRVILNQSGNITDTCPFRGNFNGGGHKIKNLTMDTINNYVGLFGYLLTATIENLGIDSTCTFTCPSHGGWPRYYGGTLVAYSENSDFNRCYSLGEIAGNSDWWGIGGLIGGSFQDEMRNCYSRAKIFHNSNSEFQNSRYGGLIGEVVNTNTFLIQNSYSAPDTIPSGSWARPPGRPQGQVGALIGNAANTNNIVNTYYLKKLYYNSNSGSMEDHMTIVNIGIAKYIGEMRTEQFAVDLNACQTNTWRWANRDNTLNNGLPMLYWQGIGDTIGCTVSGGTPTAPYRIRYAIDLIRLSNDVADGVTYSNTHFIVENDISFKIGTIDSSRFFKPIGNVEINTSSGNIVNNYSFQGHFNGNGHVISNLTLSTTNNNNSNYVGLFGNILNAKIDSVGIDSTCSFSCPSHNNGTYYAGGLTAYSINSNFNSCYSKVILTVAGNRWCVGGLIGGSDRDTINNCYSRTNMSRTSNDSFWESFYGGLIGKVIFTDNFYLSNSYSAPVALPYNNNSTNTGSLVGNIDGNNSHIINSHYINISGTNKNTGTLQAIAFMRTQPFVTLLNATQSPQPWRLDANNINNGLAILGWQVVLGTEDNPFKISCVLDLINLSNNVSNGTSFLNKFFSVVNDISFNNGVVDSSLISFGFKPIGSYITNTNNKPFSGTIKGNGYAIANYKFSNNTTDNVGLFGYTKDAKIRNLGISNINISARNNVGGLVAITNNTTIDSCFVYGYINGVRNVGGLVGFDTIASTINRSFTNTSIDALTNVGGIVGNHNGGTINNSYSNSEIYSSTTGNDYVGGIIGRASSSNLTNIYSACKIIRNGITNTNFGKIKGNNSGTNTNCYSRDNVFVNCDNITPTGYNGNPKTNAELRDATFANTTLGTANWKTDYTDRINDGYPILNYQLAAAKVNVNGPWQAPSNWVGSVLPKASQVAIIPNGRQIKIVNGSAPMVAYVKIEKGGELNNTTNINLFGEYNRELFVGKWNLIGLSTYNQNLASLINFTDTAYKTFVKTFNYTTNNWSATTIELVNTKFKNGEGILVMPNYSLDARLLSTSRIVSKGVLYNENTSSYPFNNTSTATNKFVSLANNYPASLNVTQNNPPISGNTAGLIQGNLVYVYDANNAVWINNINSSTPITKIKPSEGFFIAPSSASGNFIFNKSQINNTSGAKNLIKSDLIYVQATADSNIRESFLEFNEEADNGFDFEDGFMLFGNNYNSVEPFFTIPTPEIYDSTTQLIKDAFSSLPYTTELNLRSQKTNEVSINFSNIPSNIHAYLLDSLLNKAQYINEQPNYELQVNEGDNSKRLYVLFSYNKEDKNAFFKPEMPQEIRIWNYNNVMNIEGKDLIRYEIYDVIGNKLLEQEVFNDDFQTQLSLNNGIYIVRAYSKTNSKTGKLSVNN